MASMWDMKRPREFAKMIDELCPNKTTIQFARKFPTFLP